MIKHVIFDFDGTLVDSTNVFLAIWNKLAESHNFKQIKHRDIETMKKLSIKERSRLVNFPMYKIPLFIPKFYKMYRDSIKDIVLKDGMKEVVSELNRNGYQIAIVSSNSKENIKSVLKRNQLNSITNIYSSSSIFGKDKLIHKFLKEQHLEPSEVIYIGDEQRDIIACQKAGVKIIWVDWGYDSFEKVDTLKPDFHVHSPAEILKIIK